MNGDSAAVGNFKEATSESNIQKLSRMLERRKVIASQHEYASPVTPKINGPPGELSDYVDPNAEVVGELPEIGEYIVYYADLRKDPTVQGKLTNSSEFCKHCGNRLPPESTFCNKCGMKIDEGR